MNALALAYQSTPSTRHFNRLMGKTTLVRSTGRYAPAYQDFIGVFVSELRKWESETSLLSDIDRVLAHPSFRRIVDLGDVAVPLVVNELSLRPTLLVFALEEISGERPYPRDSQGDVQAMTAAWLLWAEHQR